MDWSQPLLILTAIPAVLAVWWFQRRTLHPMSPRRRKALTAVRAALLVLLVIALAQPAWRWSSSDQAVIVVLDHSQSQGADGQRRATARASELIDRLSAHTYVGVVSAGSSPKVVRTPQQARPPLEIEPKWLVEDGSQTNLEDAVILARGLFPAATSGRIVLLGDGIETQGNLLSAAREAAATGVAIDVVPIAGQARPDARLVQLRTSRSRLHEGATLELMADIESSLAGKGRIRLFENGIEVESQPLELTVGSNQTVTFRRIPAERSLYTYRARLEGFAGDELPENDDALALVDVRGQPLLLYVEGDPGEAHYLADAMSREGIRLQVRPASAIPESLAELAGYDGIILSDVAAREISEPTMLRIRDYVEQLGGGFLMIGGTNAFGVGGYYRTPIEDLLPVKMKAPDTEMQYATALMLVIDRSSSMAGQKIELCKSACVATVEMLSRKDFLGVVAFDSAATWIVPLAKLSSPAEATSRIATINPGGGTNLQPAMTEGHQALAAIQAKIKHMIILTDGQTMGGGYEALSAQMKQEGMTVSTVAVGSGADVGLLQRMATAGGGQAYVTTDPANVPKIFTQDAMVHMGKLIREEAFVPRQVERHVMLKGFVGRDVPPLLGYVKTNPKALAQVPLVTDLGDPLLAHWRFGLGKVTAFTSDCKTRWAATWVTGWPGYSQFWAQVLREMARPPEGQTMDMRLMPQAGQTARVEVELMEDPAQYKNNARVEADVYLVPAGSLGSRMRHVQSLELDQTGPGLYSRQFRSDQPGVYLVRARSGADIVSAGLVHNPSGEAATGLANTGLLTQVATITGGRLLAAPDSIPTSLAVHAQYVELAPFLLRLVLLLFVADLVIRRWENVLGVWEALDAVRGKFRK